jgi:hypothetical protein
MPYTRRDLIRDAALIAATGAVAGLPFAFGSRKKLRALGLPQTSAVRAFFSGTWMFTAAHETGYMYAITRDMDGHNHTFPYGVWQTKFDTAIKTVLEPISQDASGKLAPHKIEVTGFSASQDGTAESVFQDALNNFPFTYIQSPDSNKKITLTTGYKDLRVIRLPVPTSIYPAAYLVDASIQDPNGMVKTPPASADYGDVTGLPTTHIFEYARDNNTTHATTLTFTDASGGTPINVNSSDSVVDFHVHTVPPKGDKTDHSACMFNNLISILTINGVALGPCDLMLVDSCPNDVEAGPNSPPGGDDELEFDSSQSGPCDGTDSRRGNERILAYTLASCSGSGFAVGGVGN